MVTQRGVLAINAAGTSKFKSLPLRAFAKVWEMDVDDTHSILNLGPCAFADCKRLFSVAGHLHLKKQGGEVEHYIALICLKCNHADNVKRKTEWSPLRTYTRVIPFKIEEGMKEAAPKSASEEQLMLLDLKL